jgi:hypothetical protein
MAASREEIVPTYGIPALVRAPEIKWRWRDVV